MVMDVDDQESICHTATTVNKEYGRLILINNAGVYMDDNKKLVAMDPSILERTMATNFFGPYHVIRSFIPLMEQQAMGQLLMFPQNMER